MRGLRIGKRFVVIEFVSFCETGTIVITGAEKIISAFGFDASWR